MRTFCLLVLVIVSQFGCASVSPSDAAVRSIVHHFTIDGFPAETTPSVMELLLDSRLGTVRDINGAAFWYSRDGRVSIEFEVQGCPAGALPVRAVLIVSNRSSRTAAIADVKRWLVVAAPPQPPDMGTLTSREGFKATWFPKGQQVYIEAFIYSYETEWFGVVKIRPEEVFMVGAEGRPNPSLQRTRFARR